jgi:transcriptional regulator with XRE-family HTH domain
MEPNAIIGRNVKAYRDKLHYTQDAIANFLGVKRELISYYENGKREIDLIKLEKLADLFNIELQDLLSEDSDVRELDIATAFRAEGLDESDLIKISEFQRIIKNFTKMQALALKNDD